MRRMLIVSLLCAQACEGDEAPAPSVDLCDDKGDSKLVVIQKLTFVRQEAGLSEGFDLDGDVSAMGGATGCGVADLSSPGGETGIDNAFSFLLPALELTEAAAVEGLIQATIDSGDLLIAAELGELDDPVDDDCVDLWVGRASGVPLRGTDGRILSGQTFDVDTTSPSVSVEQVPLAGGILEAPVEMRIPVTIFDVSLDFTLENGRIRSEILPDGRIVGMFGGGVDIASLLQIALEENVDSGLYGVLEPLLTSWSDLAPDESGQCQQLSITFAFEAVPAFWYPESAL